MTRAVRPVAILGGNRIPFARSDSHYAQASNQDMLTAALNGLVARFGLAGQRDKLNVTGSSLAVGHPFAATGGRVVATLAKLLHAQALDTGRPTTGLISVCAAGGQGVVALLRHS